MKVIYKRYFIKVKKVFYLLGNLSFINLSVALLIPSTFPHLSFLAESLTFLFSDYKNLCIIYVLLFELDLVFSDSYLLFVLSSSSDTSLKINKLLFLKSSLKFFY